jgi:hypothetical protein
MASFSCCSPDLSAVSHLGMRWRATVPHLPCDAACWNIYCQYFSQWGRPDSRLGHQIFSCEALSILIKPVSIRHLVNDVQVESAKTLRSHKV